MSASPPSWLENVRIAVKSWLMEDPAVNGEVADTGDLTYLAAPFPDVAHGIVGRKVFVEDANEIGNIGTYTVAAYESANRLQLTPTWPVPDPGGYATFRLESRLAAYIRTRNGKFFWHDTEGSLPSSITAADMPSLEMIPRGAGTIRQQTNVDLQLTDQFHFILAAAGKPMAELKFLYSILHDRLVRGRTSRYGFDQAANGVGIGSCRPENLAFNQLEYRADGKAGPIATGYFNNCEFDWLIDLRRQPDTMA